MEILVNLINQIVPVITFIAGLYIGHYWRKHDEIPNIPKQIKEDIKEAKEEKKNEKKKKEIEEKMKAAETYMNNIDNFPHNQKPIN